MTSYGIYEKALLSSDLKNSLAQAKALGYDFWEISVDKQKKERLDWDKEKIEELLLLCHETAMPIYNMVLSINRDYPLGHHDPSVREQGLNYLVSAIDLAVKLGIRTIQLAGYYTSGPGKDDGNINHFIKTLAKGVKYAEAKGVMLAIENMDYDLISSQQILKVINEINSPYLQAFLDVGNFTANDLVALDELDQAYPRLVGIHIKEAEKQVFRRVEFGKGIVPFDQIFTYLDQKGYAGYFGIEMWNDEQNDSMVWVEKALAYIKSNQ